MIAALEGAPGEAGFVTLTCSPDGPIITWDAESEILLGLAFLRGDIEQGPSFQWREDGSLALVGSWIDGHSDGAWLEFYPSGKLRSVAFHREDRIEGRYREWSEAGQLRVDGRYVDGARDGEWLFFEEDGEATLRVFEDGRERESD